MEDKLDLALLDKFAKKSPKEDEQGIYYEYDWTLSENDTITWWFGNTREGFIMWQTPPSPAFFKIYKEYYPNGYLKLKGKRMGGDYTLIGEWEYYNENGELVHTWNEDEKFDAFGYNELLLFLHQQKHINTETGENRERVDFGYDVEKKQWWVETTSSRYWITKYIIDGKTGEVIDKKEFQGGQM